MAGRTDIVERLSEFDASQQRGFLQTHVPSILEQGVPGAGAIGYVAGVPFSWMAADNKVHEKLLKLFGDWRETAAQQYGVDPASLNERHFFQAAMQNPALQKSVEAIYDVRDRHSTVNIGSMAGTAGGAAVAAAATTAAVVSGPAGWALWLAAPMLGMSLGKMVGQSVAGAESALDPVWHKDRIDVLRAQNAPLEQIAAAIFALRVSQDEELQEGIKGAMDGVAYHKLPDDKKQDVMLMADKLSANCAQEADLLKRHGEIRTEQLLFHSIIGSPVLEFEEAGLQEMKPQAPEEALPEAGPVHGHWTAKAIAEGKGPGGGSRSFADRVSVGNAPSGPGAAL